MRISTTVGVACVVLGLVTTGLADATPADAEIQALLGRVDGLEVVQLPATGELTLVATQALTVDALRGVALDENPPELGTPTEPYPPRMTDDCPPGEQAYVAEGIAPFGFRHFNNEFNYGGWHNWAMIDYASAHGFGIIGSYNHRPERWTHVPAGTRWLTWGGHVNWDRWLEAHDIPPARYDMLAQMDVAGIMAEEQVFKSDPAFDQLMIDMEHGRLSPEKLREQEWYPKGASETEQQAFEKRYYDGYAKTYAGPVEAARRVGYRDISVYGWQPFGRRFFGIDEVELDPATNHAWNAYGKQIYEAVDILNPSVYCFYWTPQNLAYTLANIDLNMHLVNSQPVRKPVRPYYWTLLHGGGGGWRWWKGQPLSNEETRAMTAMCFFTGCDGLVLWNWSGTGSHQVPPPLKAEADVMVAESFELRAEGIGEDAEPTAFERYDVLHLVSVGEDETARFQRIDKSAHRDKYGVTPDKPVYAMAADELRPHLRAAAEPVSAMVEGLALIKPLEYVLRHGEVRIDVPAAQQFAGSLPIVRRVKHGKYHVLITYNPTWAEDAEPKHIVLEDFDGRDGLTLSAPADAQTRVYLLKD